MTFLKKNISNAKNLVLTSNQPNDLCILIKFVLQPQERALFWANCNFLRLLSEVEAQTIE